MEARPAAAASRGAARRGRAPSRVLPRARRDATDGRAPRGPRVRRLGGRRRRRARRARCASSAPGHADPRHGRAAARRCAAGTARASDRQRRRGPRRSSQTRRAGDLRAASTVDELPDASHAERRLSGASGPSSWLVVPLRAGDRIARRDHVPLDRPRPRLRRARPPGRARAGRPLRAGASRNAQRYDEAQSARALLDTVFADGAGRAWRSLDTDLRFVLLNDRLAAINGRPVDEHVGRTVQRGARRRGRRRRRAARAGHRAPATPMTDVEVVAATARVPRARTRRSSSTAACSASSARSSRRPSATAPQQKVARSEARFRALVDAGADRRRRAGAATRILHANDAFLRMHRARSRERSLGGLTWQSDSRRSAGTTLDDARRRASSSRPAASTPYEKEFTCTATARRCPCCSP